MTYEGARSITGPISRAGRKCDSRRYRRWLRELIGYVLRLHRLPQRSDRTLLDVHAGWLRHQFAGVPFLALAGRWNSPQCS